MTIRIQRTMSVIDVAITATETGTIEDSGGDIASRLLHVRGRVRGVRRGTTSGIDQQFLEVEGSDGKRRRGMMIGMRVMAGG